MEFNYDICSSYELNGINKFKRYQESVLFKNIERDLDIMVNAAKSGDKIYFDEMNYEISFVLDIMNGIDLYSVTEKVLLSKLFNRVISVLHKNYFVENFE